MFKLKYTKNQIPDVVDQLVNHLAECKIITFTGSLGAGKTTIISQLVRQLGTTDQVNSPTFTYVNIYSLSNGKKIYHFDLYRITSLEEFIAAGFDEYLYAPNSWALIEWPEIIEPLLTHDVCRVNIDHEIHKPDERVITISCVK